LPETRAGEIDMLDQDLYQKLYLARRAEEKIREHYMEDEMKTPMHMSMGEEAIAVGVCQALKAGDQVFATYRSHAIYLAKTQNIDDFFAEMYGKDTALLKGKGGSMHMCAPESGFMGTSAIVASIIPVAIGAAFANKQQGNSKLVVVFFGDGALDEGAFWESLNTACLMKLPILFVCEDNGLAVHTPTSKRQGYASITDIVSRFNCNLLKENTTDAEVIYKLTKKATKLIRTTQMPCFMHLRYYRYLEHVGVNEDFDAGYRSRAEFEEWYKKDPINLQRKKLLQQGIREEEIIKLEKEIDNKIEKSVRLAKEAPFAEVSELYNEVFT
jgi:TPP-dependent pyruvate/acetoin dehydrogenase alpha subunit